MTKIQPIVCHRMAYSLAAWSCIPRQARKLSFYTFLKPIQEVRGTNALLFLLEKYVVVLEDKACNSIDLICTNLFILNVLQ